MTKPVGNGPRAALYLRVSTVRQAEYDVSIPDQRRQGEAYCRARQYEVAEIFVEQGASGTNDRRPEFRRMIDAAASVPRPFEIIVVHSFSRFFRDHIELELYVRKLGRNGVKLMSMTQEIGEDPMHVMMRQVIALFDEYQSKENGKHVIRALKENARQGFWCGSTPPIGYRTIAAEMRGDTLKKKLAIDPNYVNLIRLIYRLALHGTDGRNPMGTKKIASYLNVQGIRTQAGGRWGTGQVHRVLTRRTYMGEHSYNKLSKSGKRNPESEVIIVSVPPIVSRNDFTKVQEIMQSRRVEFEPRRLSSRVPLLKGLAFCGICGGALTARVAKSGRYQYYTCSIRSRQGPAGCHGTALPVANLDMLIRKFISGQLLKPRRLEPLAFPVIDSRRKPFEELAGDARDARMAADDAEAGLQRLVEAIETGVVALTDPSVATRIARLRKKREQLLSDADRADHLRDSIAENVIEMIVLVRAAIKAQRNMRTDAPAIIKFLNIVFRRIEVGPETVKLRGAKTCLVDGILHIGAGAVITDLEWRRSLPIDKDDAFEVVIPRQ